MLSWIVSHTFTQKNFFFVHLTGLGERHSEHVAHTPLRDPSQHKLTTHLYKQGAHYMLGEEGSPAGVGLKSVRPRPRLPGPTQEQYARKGGSRPSGGADRPNIGKSRATVHE